MANLVRFLPTAVLGWTEPNPEMADMTYPDGRLPYDIPALFAYDADGYGYRYNHPIESPEHLANLTLLAEHGKIDSSHFVLNGEYEYGSKAYQDNETLIVAKELAEEGLTLSDVRRNW